VSQNIRKTGGRDELDALWAGLNSLTMKTAFAARDDGSIGNGTTAGNLRTTASVDFGIAGDEYTKASTDDLWDLSGETDTDASSYRAYWLYLDNAGAASIAAGSDQTSAALALENLPALTETKSIIGAFVADPSCDFDDAGGLAAQGTIYNGIPDGAYVGIPGHTYRAPELTTLVHF
jgi:hypothetical protein